MNLLKPACLKLRTDQMEVSRSHQSSQLPASPPRPGPITQFPIFQGWSSAGDQSELNNLVNECAVDGDREDGGLADVQDEWEDSGRGRWFSRGCSFLIGRLLQRRLLSLKTASQRRQTAAPLMFYAGNICQLNQGEDRVQWPRGQNLWTCVCVCSRLR